MRADDLSAGGISRAALLLLVAGLAVVAVWVTLGVLRAAGAFGSQEMTRQEEVAERGAEVMPFDLEKTTHVFEPTQTGGVQKVVADDPSDGEQIALIRAHLREEAGAFRRGDLQIRPRYTAKTCQASSFSRLGPQRSTSATRTCLMAPGSSTRRRTRPWSRRCTSGSTRSSPTLEGTRREAALDLPKAPITP
jgi:hypothetical protein